MHGLPQSSGYSDQCFTEPANYTYWIYSWGHLWNCINRAWHFLIDFPLLWYYWASLYCYQHFFLTIGEFQSISQIFSKKRDLKFHFSQLFKPCQLCPVPVFENDVQVLVLAGRRVWWDCWKQKLISRLCSPEVKRVVPGFQCHIFLSSFYYLIQLLQLNKRHEKSTEDSINGPCIRASISLEKSISLCFWLLH